MPSSTRSDASLDNLSLDSIESCAESPRELAWLRIQSLPNPTGGSSGGGGVALALVRTLRAAVDEAQRILVQEPQLRSSSLSESDGIRSLRRILQLLRRIALVDRCLDEEVARFGSHAELRRVLKWDALALATSEPDQDLLVELQDVAGELAAGGGRLLPQAAAVPFSESELQQRLPLAFTFEPVVGTVSAPDNHPEIDALRIPPVSILIHQVSDRQAAQQDVGFVLWPSAVVLSRYLASNPAIVWDAPRILELGAGCGLVGLTAAMVAKHRPAVPHPAVDRPDGSSSILSLFSATPVVYLTDFNATVLRNLESNVALNEVSDLCRVVGLDFHRQRCAEVWEASHSYSSYLSPPPSDAVQREGTVDLVLAADVICQPSDAVAAALMMSKTLRPGGRAVVVSAAARHRFGVERFVPACQECGLEVSVEAVQDLWEGKLLRASGQDLAQTSGYVEGMQLNFYQIRKP